MYTCPDCGSEMRFDPSRQKLYCEFCGKTLDPQADDVRPAKTAEESPGDNWDRRTVSPEQAMAVHQAARSGEEEITPARLRYEAYLAKKAEAADTSHTEPDESGNIADSRKQGDIAGVSAGAEESAGKGKQTGTKEAVSKEKPAGTEKAVNKEKAPAAEKRAAEKKAGEEKTGEKKSAGVKIRPTYQACVFTCPSCGAELISGQETVATFCSYCGSSVLLESRIREESCPDYVIPFRITREACEKAYRKTLRKALFVPSEMKQDTQIERFRGIYMPYWIYSFEQDGAYRVAGSKSRRRGDYVYTSHYRLESRLTASCKGLAYDASSAFADTLSTAIAPFDAREGTEFTPEYLSGFYADRGDVSEGIYYSEAKEMAGGYVAQQARKKSIYRKYNASESSMAGAFSPKRTKAELGMFPVWFLGCRSHDGKRISYAVVNGQTGRVAADLPIDMKKYLLGSLCLAVPLFILLNLFLTLTPTKALICAIALALVSLLLSNRQLNRIYTRDCQLDDMGLWSVTDVRNRKAKPKTTSSKSAGSMILRILGLIGAMWASMIVVGIVAVFAPFRSAAGFMAITVVWVVLMFCLFRSVLAKPVKRNQKRAIYPAPLKEKMGTLYKPLIAIAVALVILIWNPALDLFYYIGASVSLGCVIWSFFDIIKEHNLLTTRKLPHLGRRGGDENA